MTDYQGSSPAIKMFSLVRLKADCKMPPVRADFSTPLVNKFVRVGGSPRAAQALVLGAKCRALLDGRPSVSVDDLQAIAPAALRHRLILNFEGEAEGITADRIIEEALAAG